ncbi:MAG: response regulator [Candidatus Tenebribacter burtonii]|nr:response regulator [Candidatus Tenebribacter burtonii]
MKKKVKILIAENEVIIAQCLKMELELKGYEVCNFVATGEEAIIEAKEENPDIILMDINLLGFIDGIDAAKEITKSKKIPIIFMTGYNDIAFFERAQKVNPVAYLEKPVEIYDIEPIIESIFK